MSDTMIDSEARERLSTVEAVLWGPNKDNGLRSEVRAVQKKTDDLETAMRHYVDTRPEHCLGLKALAAHEQAEGQLYEESQEEDANMQIARMQNGTEVKKAKWQVIAALVTAAFLFAGQVVTTAQASATQRTIAAMAQTLKARK